MKKRPGGSGAGAPQKIFSIIGSKILLKNKKKANKQGGVKTTVKISRNITVWYPNGTQNIIIEKYKVKTFQRRVNRLHIYPRSKVTAYVKKRSFRIRTLKMVKYP